MAVNSFREDEHIQATDAKKIVNRLLGYLKGYTKEVILVPGGHDHYGRDQSV